MSDPAASTLQVSLRENKGVREGYLSMEFQ
jgi:hypothetical protein